MYSTGLWAQAGREAGRAPGPPQIITHTEGIRQATIGIAPSTLPRGQTQCPRDHPRYITRSSSKFGLLVTHYPLESQPSNVGRHTAVTPGDRGFAVHSSSFTQAHVRATHQRRDVGAATGADAGQTPDMPPLRCAHAPGPPRANAPRATHRVATPCTGPPSGRVRGRVGIHTHTVGWSKHQP